MAVATCIFVILATKAVSRIVLPIELPVDILSKYKHRLRCEYENHAQNCPWIGSSCLYMLLRRHWRHNFKIIPTILFTSLFSPYNTVMISADQRVKDVLRLEIYCDDVWEAMELHSRGRFKQFQSSLYRAPGTGHGSLRRASARPGTTYLVLVISFLSTYVSREIVLKYGLLLGTYT